jgi:hypothetical protein
VPSITPNRTPDANRLKGELTQRPVKGNEASSNMGSEHKTTNNLRGPGGSTHGSEKAENADPKRIPA